MRPTVVIETQAMTETPDFDDAPDFSEFPERIEYPDLDDEDLEESIAQIKNLIKISGVSADDSFAKGLQSSIDRMTNELAGRKNAAQARR